MTGLRKPAAYRPQQDEVAGGAAGVSHQILGV